jgi:signal transduction histidine kinase
MSIFAIPAALALAINLTLCLVVFFNNPRAIVNQVFTLLMLSFVAWNVGELIMINSDYPATALVGVKVIFPGVFLFPVFFLHFSFVFPQRLTTFLDGWRSLILYAGPVALLVPFVLLLEIDIGRVLKIGSVFYYVFAFKGPLESHILALILSLVGLGCFSWGVVNFLLSYRQTRIARQRLQILYLLVGVISMFVIGLILHVTNYLVEFGYSFFFVASLYSLLISFFFALAIVKYRLVDIHFIIRRSILYSALSGLVLVIYVLFIKNITDIMARKMETNSLLMEAGFVLILVFLLRPLERRIEEFMDRYFYRERHLFRLKFFEFTRVVVNILDLPVLLRTTVIFISESLAVEKGAVLILDPAAACYRISGQIGEFDGISFPHDGPFVSYLKDSRRAVELEFAKRYDFLQPEIRKMMGNGCALAVPLEGKEGMLGFLLVGQKKSGKSFSIMEIEALEALAPSVAMAISRALLSQDLKDKAQEVMQAEKMAAIGEMAASFVHEIRNPLGIILGSVETLKKKVPTSVRKEMMEFIVEEAERINDMLTNFLDFAKPKAPAFREVDVTEVLEKTVELFSGTARELKVEISREFPEEKVLLYADPEQIRQALVNLELNALEAMPQGGMLKISLTRNQGEEAMIRISDTGVGIPAGAETKIFDPFFTTKERGTGLGLSIVYRVVKNHGGTISVEPNDDKGATFILTLPLTQGLSGCRGTGDSAPAAKQKILTTESTENAEEEMKIYKMT